jgi:hypothetical protein
VGELSDTERAVSLGCGDNGLEVLDGVPGLDWKRYGKDQPLESGLMGEIVIVYVGLVNDHVLGSLETFSLDGDVTVA